MSFKLEKFIPCQMQLLQKQEEKKNYSQLKNFSSNELMHSLLKELSQDFFRKDLSETTRCYPYFPPFRELISTHYQLSNDQVLLAPGSDFMINLLLMTLKKQQSIILLNPEYYSYARYAQFNDFSIRTTKLDFLNFEKSFHNYKEMLSSSKPSIVVISNPSGITGLKISLAQMRAIADYCCQFNHLLIIDEAYSAFEEINHTSLIQDFSNIVILKSFSKSHGIAGLRFATVFSNRELISYLKLSGIENSVSGASLSYFYYLMQNTEIIKKIHQDILFSKQEFSKFIKDQFPSWILYPTATHFLTIDTIDEQLSKNLVSFLYNNNIAIKQLGSVSDLKTCIRITIAEFQYMLPIINLIKIFVIEYRHQQTVSSK